MITMTLITEAATRRVLCKKVFLVFRYLTKFTEKHPVPKPLFLIKLQA